MAENNDQMNNPHDTGYQYLLKSKKAFTQLLRSFVKQGWSEQVDEADLILVNKSFILQDFNHKEADIVYRAKVKDNDVIFYVLLEHQSTVDFQMPYRLLLYMTEIWRYIVENTDSNEVKRKDFRLPVIIPIVLYNGENNWTVPLNFSEYLNGSDFFGEYSLNFKYSLIDVYNYNKDELLKTQNLIGSVFLLDQAKDFTEIINRLLDLSDVLRQMGEQDFKLFINWTTKILGSSLSPQQQEEFNSILQETHPKEVDKMISNVERVLKKSHKDAEEEGVKKVAKSMLAKGYEIDEIIEITNLTKEEIEKLKE